MGPGEPDRDLGRYRWMLTPLGVCLEGASTKGSFCGASDVGKRSLGSAMVSLVEEEQNIGPSPKDSSPPEEMKSDALSRSKVEGEPASVEVDLDPELYENVQKARMEGNEAFRSGEYELSLLHYERALEGLLHPSIVSTKKSDEIYVLIRSNMAAAYLKLGEYRHAREQCDYALATDNRCVKALFRRSEAWRGEYQYALAISDLEKALLREPNNMAIKLALDECEDELAMNGTVPMVENASANAKGGPLDQKVSNFVTQVMNEAREQFQNHQHVEASLVLEHEVGLTKELQWGRVRVGSEAFESSENLESMTAFVRGKQATSSAHSVCITVQKSDIQYPLVWWSSPWPWIEEMDCDGIFVEVETKEKQHRTWFMKLDPQSLTLEEPVELDARYRLAESSFFP